MLSIEKSERRADELAWATEQAATSELLAGLLGGPRSAEQAARLLERAGGLAQLASFGAGGLQALGGAGRAGAIRVAAALELGRRAAAESTRPRRSMRHPSEVAAYFCARLGALAHEEMWVASLDGRCALRAARRVAQGGGHGCVVGAAEVLRAALLDGAATFVVVHNHPSGDPTPSQHDVAMTRALVAAAETVGIPLCDHVIVTASAHVSLLDSGLLGAGCGEGPRGPRPDGGHRD